MFFIGNAGSEKIAEKLAKKLFPQEFDIPESIIKKLTRQEMEVFDHLSKEHFRHFSLPVQSRLKIIMDDCGYIDHLTSRVKGKNEEKVIEALEILGNIKVKKTFRTLVECLRDKRDGVNIEAAHALIKMRDKRIVDFLVKELVKEDSDILPARMGQIFIGLGSLSIEPLIEVFPNLSEKGKINVMEIFAEIKEPRALDILEEVVLEGPPEVKVQAILALKEICSESSLACLEEAVNDDKEAVKENARLAIRQIAAAEN